jgi:hypothetical protein
LELTFTIRGSYSYQDFQFIKSDLWPSRDIFRERIPHPCGTEPRWSGPGVNAEATVPHHFHDISSSHPFFFHYTLFMLYLGGLKCPRSPKAMALCASCREFDLHKFNAKNKNTQCFELTLVAIAASEGCPFCKFIYDNKPSHNSTWEMSDLWIHYRMLTPADVEYDMLPSGPGLRFTQLQVWVGSKKALAGGGGLKYFRLISEPGT